MGFEVDVGHLGLAGRIDCSQRALTVPDEHPFSLRVDADIVRIIAKLDTRDRREILAAKDTHRAVTGICDIDKICERGIAHALGFAKAGDGVQHLRWRQVDHAQAVVPSSATKSRCRFTSMAR
jgi:hypothetical protein